MLIESKIQDFFSNYPPQIYKKGEVLIQAGTIPAAYYVVDGLVIQYDIGKNGDKLVVNTYQPGAFVPLTCILNDIPTVFFFEATETTTVRVASAADTVAFLRDNPDVVYDAPARVSRGGSGLMQRLARAMDGDAEGRIMQELLILRSRFFADSGVVSVTDTDLAIKTGLARETISRALKKLDTEGTIRATRGKITILDTHHI